MQRRQPITTELIYTYKSILKGRIYHKMKIVIIFYPQVILDPLDF